MNQNVKSTSVKTYQKLQNSGQLNKQQKKVLQAFINIPYVATRNEVKHDQLSDWEKSTISGRVNELVEKGFLQECGKREDRYSGRTAQVLMVTQPKKGSKDLESGDVIFG